VSGITWGLSLAGDEAAVRKELRFLANDGIQRENEIGQLWSLTRKDGAKFGGPGSGMIYFIQLEADGTGKIRSGSEFWDITITVDPGKKPKTMDIEYQSGPHKGKKQYAIYQIDKEQLKLLATHPGAKAEDRPKAFDKRDAEKTTLLEFHRNYLFSIE
jgi:uncharacterized protein (TIGR03067 family)